MKTLVTLLFGIFWVWVAVAGIDRYGWVNRPADTSGRIQAQFVADVGERCPVLSDHDHLEFVIRDKRITYRCPRLAGDTIAMWPLYKQFTSPRIPALLTGP